ncbi:MAG: DUF1761 domain-containing protein [Candidatus Magasanikbacteria bacterium]|jgi:NAD/NADP transhydrogenase beta subunit|nr:DUF1761 domain-containing protein [Candidatus Magasanikbacteria bacterium]
MEINILAVIVATLVQFAIGAVWYGPLFGKLWGKIHGFDKLSKEVQAKMMKAMAPFYALQLFVTIVTSVVLSIILSNLSDWNIFMATMLLWIGFVVPAQVSAVIFGGTESKWIVTKIILQAGGSLACLLAAAFVINLF